MRRFKCKVDAAKALVPAAIKVFELLGGELQSPPSTPGCSTCASRWEIIHRTRRRAWAQAHASVKECLGCGAFVTVGDFYGVPS
jgi:hypothetical protein